MACDTERFFTMDGGVAGESSTLLLLFSSLLFLCSSALPLFVFINRMFFTMHGVVLERVRLGGDCYQAHVDVSGMSK